jgi:hypothetical protein
MSIFVYGYFVGLGVFALAAGLTLRAWRRRQQVLAEARARVDARVKRIGAERARKVAALRQDPGRPAASGT